MDTIAVERAHMSGVYPKRKVAIVSGKGARVVDAEGREYIDCVAGHGVANLGHGHPAIVAAVHEQAQKLITCPGIFFNDCRARLMQRLTALLPRGVERLFLCNSGTESVEAAIKFARLHTGRARIVATMRGFHGRTMGSLSATWNKKYRQPFQPLVPEFDHVPFDNIAAAEQAVTTDTAGVLVEIVQGEGGVRPGSRDYFYRLRELCDERGALLIIDEVQTGFGRTGKWFACQHYGIDPDLICLGKAIAGGIPMGATGISRKIGELAPGMHGSTFGGNPLACAAALAAIDAYERERLIERSHDLGKRARATLQEMRSPLVREVRGWGLLIGLELKTRCAPFLKKLFDRRILALPAGATVLRLLPPLVIGEDDLNEVLAAVQTVLEEEN